MQTVADELELKGRAARKAARELAKLPSAVKDRALLNVADGLRSRHEEILQANEKDCAAGREGGLSESLLDRLLLTPERLEGIANDVIQVAALPDPARYRGRQATPAKPFHRLASNGFRAMPVMVPQRSRHEDSGSTCRGVADRGSFSSLRRPPIQGVRPPPLAHPGCPGQPCAGHWGFDRHPRGSRTSRLSG